MRPPGLLGYSGQGNLRIFGPSNEKYHVRGGNDQTPSRLAAQLSRQITLNHALIAINQNTWDVSRSQTGTSGILVDYTGGTIGASFDSGTPDSRAQQFLTQLEPVLPGISARYNGRATLDHWTGYQWTRGSYSCWKVGQYTKFAGVEREPQGRALNCHFAGEHTSIDFQGYLNGGVETGERAAEEVIAALR